LAGGNTPRAAYEALALEPDVLWPKISIYFGDERCVPPDHEDSNFRMARQALFERLPAPAPAIHRMRGEERDREKAAREYEAILPEAIDVIVLGIGEDGHTASLFPRAPALRETTRRVLHVTGPKPPPDRLTVTPEVLRRAAHVIVLASGANKSDAVARALEGPPDIESCPIQLVRDAVWLMDHEAASKLTGTWPETE
jgi:6-phosphogluconolactonase